MVETTAPTAAAADRGFDPDRDLRGWARFYHRQYMLVPGLGGNLWMYLECYTIFSNGRVEGVGYLSALVVLWVFSSWLVYGFVLRNRVLTYANIIGVIGAILRLIGVTMYGDGTWI